jgi:Arc/MetJ-type ribon-helix-helix transcriptional regulator
MRQIFNISMPPRTAEKVREAVSTGHYSSTSEFFRDLLRDWQDGKLLVDLKESRKEIKEGGGKTLRSLKDLR